MDSGSFSGMIVESYLGIKLLLSEALHLQLWYVDESNVCHVPL